MKDLRGHKGLCEKKKKGKKKKNDQTTKRSFHETVQGINTE